MQASCLPLRELESESKGTNYSPAAARRNRRKGKKTKKIIFCCYICNLLCLSSQVPCSLEYWDELQQAFVPYREFSLSESTACQLQLPSLSLTDQQKELVASDLWRIVLNNNGEGGDEQRWQKNVQYFILTIQDDNNILFLFACRYPRVLCVCLYAKFLYNSTQKCVWVYVYRPVWGKAEGEHTQAAEHKELAMCPSPHIWCAGAGSGLGRRSDRPNEISQHTKCLSGPIRIPSCLPWVYLIEGKLTGSKRSKAPFGLAHKFLGLAWPGLGWAGFRWDGMDWACQALSNVKEHAFTPPFSLPLLPLFIAHTSPPASCYIFCASPNFNFFLSFSHPFLILIYSLLFALSPFLLPLGI